MDAVSRAAFRRELERLDGEAFVSFVADLYAARGFAVERDGRRLHVVGGPSPRRERLVVVEPREGGREADTVVSRSGGRDDAIGVDDLHGMVAYALDRETREVLLERHFGGVPTGGRAAGRVRPDPGSAVAALAVALAVSVALAATAAGPIVAPSGAPWKSTAGSPAPPSVTPVPSVAPSPTASPAATAPTAACPAPPTTAAPAELRPRLRVTSSDGGLTTWGRVDAMVVTSRALLEQPGRDPVAAYLATYVAPGERVFDVEIARWAAPDVAREDGVRRVSDSPAWGVWGSYTFAVRARDASGDPLPSGAVRGGARELLSAVRVGGAYLGRDCAAAIVR